MRAANLPSLRGYITNGLALRIAVAKSISEVEVYFNRGSANAETDKSLALKTFLEAALAAVEAAEAKTAWTLPVNTVAPAVTGTATQGETLTTTNGTWTGTPTPTLSREWLRTIGGVTTVIAGQTGTTYVLALADVGATIRSRVTGVNSKGGPVTALSNSTAAVAGL